MFKSIQVLRINPEWISDFNIIEEALEKFRFVACGTSEERSTGWTEPRHEKHAALAESIGGQWLFKIMTESKIIPGSVIKEMLDERKEQILAQTGRKPSKKELSDLKDDIRLELIAKAFTKKSASFVWIDPEAHMLIVEACSSAKLDEILTLLTKSLPDFGVQAINTVHSPAGAMSAWLVSQDAPAGFTADRDCVLKVPDESGSTVKYAKHELNIEEIRVHIENGKVPTQLAMTWNSRISFILSDAGMVKKIEFLDIIFASKVEKSDFDADAAITTSELRKLIPDLLSALGGEADQALATKVNKIKKPNETKEPECALV